MTTPNYKKYYSSLACLFVLVLASVYLYFTSYTYQQDLISAQESRYSSYLLATQLRRSSDELTRLARTYVSTNNPIFEEQYWKVLGIRNGEHPLPDNYDRVYWDMLAIKDNPPPFFLGKPVSLKSLMEKEAFTEKEFQFLESSQRKSNALVHLEFKAFNAMKGKFKGKEGNYTITAAPNPQMARELLYGDEYHIAKIDIMAPINHFYEELNQRTKKQVSEKTKQAYFNLILQVITFILIITAILLFINRIKKTTRRQEGLFEKIQKTQSHLMEAQQLTHFGSWELEIKSGNLFWSDEVFNIFELPPPWGSSATYDKFLNLVHPDDRATVDHAFTNSLTSGQPYDITHRLLMEDGRVKYVREVCKIKYGDSDQPLVAIGAVHDITRHKQAEEQLQIAATAFEAGDGMIITDSEGAILRVNRAFTTITGYTAEETVGQNPRMLHSGRQDKEFYRAMWETINSTGQWEGEIWDRRKNGEVYPKWLTISAVKDNSDNITHYVGTHSDISVRKQAEEKIRKLAFFDPLTELPNRTLFLDRLSQAMSASSRDGRYGALLFIDLDNLKMLNDTHGHVAGDKLLKSIAGCLKAALREGDTIARLGGDEFMVMLPGLSMAGGEAAVTAEKIAEKVRIALNQNYSLGDISHQGSASIGVTLFRGHQATIEHLIKQADLAMYKSKSSGRNSVHFFDPSMEAAHNERMVFEVRLREAIQEEQLLLYYQAQVDSEGRPTGAEALVRWLHPERGMISPADFIPLAEETGQILSVGRLVLETACAQLAEWAARPEMAHLTLSVNVSAKQFFQSDFVDQVLAILNDTGANPQQLKLELTESLLAENVESIIKTMLTLQAKGVRFSLDDFGTGYSSLSYLSRLPLEQLKIDLSFVRNILTDKNAAVIAKTIVSLGEGLGMEVIAEGVETESQREFLANLGCHHYQGYLFSRPIPVEEFEELVRGA